MKKALSFFGVIFLVFFLVTTTNSMGKGHNKNNDGSPQDPVFYSLSKVERSEIFFDQNIAQGNACVLVFFTPDMLNVNQSFNNIDCNTLMSTAVPINPGAVGVTISYIFDSENGTCYQDITKSTGNISDIRTVECNTINESALEVIPGFNQTIPVILTSFSLSFADMNSVSEANTFTAKVSTDNTIFSVTTLGVVDFSATISEDIDIQHVRDIRYKDGYRPCYRQVGWLNDPLPHIQKINCSDFNINNIIPFNWLRT